MTIGIVYPAPDNAQLNFPYPAPGATDLCVQGATANTTAKVSVAGSSRSLILSEVMWSLNGSTTPAANLTITGGLLGKVLDVDITQQGVDSLTFTPPLLFGQSEAVTVSLGPGGAGVTGKVNVVAWQLQ